MTITRWRTPIFAAALALQLAGCGTLLYPDRHGQRGDRVDPAVLILDGALLFVFIVPGLVAYGIDFYTGAIYLPGPERKVSVLHVDPRELSASRIEGIVRSHTGTDFRIDDPALRRWRLRGKQDASAVLQELRDTSYQPAAFWASAFQRPAG